MKHIFLISALMGSSVMITTAEKEIEALVVKKAEQEKKAIEVCFVLDTTGSMGGLIAGAKAKIWSIANEIAKRDDVGEIRFALVGYRDRGDDYITKVSALTNDLDAIYADLTEFQAAGGGDGPESVNQALHEAVDKIEWSEVGESNKIIFLVGDAPPHMDYEDDVKYTDSCELAQGKEIVINTIQCGSMSTATVPWQDIAQQGGGNYVALPQDGGVVHIAAPQDKEIAELSIKIYESAIASGDKEAQVALGRKKNIALYTANNDWAANAGKNSCQNVHSKEGAVIAFSGNEDLVTEWDRGNVSLDTLKRDKLPEKYQDLSDEELKKEIEKRIAERELVQEKINTLQAERAAFVEGKRAERKKGDVEMAFDEQVNEMLTEQIGK